MNITDKEKIEKNKKIAFADFMAQPLARAIIASIPATENLEVLLRAAFDHGYSAGTGDTALSFFKAIMDNEHRNGKPR